MLWSVSNIAQDPLDSLPTHGGGSIKELKSGVPRVGYIRTCEPEVPKSSDIAAVKCRIRHRITGLSRKRFIVVQGVGAALASVIMDCCMIP
ncbi:Protein kinase domain-containing protein [Psidium guajava]|nr:Protein kinase domain-containing protein [Psidium guajava]